jgi:hypothetical protein
LYSQLTRTYSYHNLIVGQRNNMITLLYCWQRHLPAELGTTTIVGISTYRHTFYITTISRNMIKFLGVLHALAWARNTSWARPCLSVCRAFRGDIQPAWLGGRISILTVYSTSMTGGRCSMGLIKLHGLGSFFLQGTQPARSGEGDYCSCRGTQLHGQGHSLFLRGTQSVLPGMTLIEEWPKTQRKVVKGRLMRSSRFLLLVHPGPSNLTAHPAAAGGLASTSFKISIYTKKIYSFLPFCLINKIRNFYRLRLMFSIRIIIVYCIFVCYDATIQLLFPRLSLAILNYSC